MGIIQAIVLFLRACIMGRAAAAVENLALRQQVAVLKQSVKRPKLRPRDRVFWVLLSWLWRNRRFALAIVQPETVLKWQRKGFRLYWRWKSSRGKPGRPPIGPKIRDLIRRECLNHVIVLSEGHLKRLLASYLEYYHGSRPHLSLDRNAPTPREVEPPSQGEVVSVPQVGGLHHRYTRAA